MVLRVDDARLEIEVVTDEASRQLKDLRGELEGMRRGARDSGRVLEEVGRKAEAARDAGGGGAGGFLAGAGIGAVGRKIADRLGFGSAIAAGGRVAGLGGRIAAGGGVAAAAAGAAAYLQALELVTSPEFVRVVSEMPEFRRIADAPFPPTGIPPLDFWVRWKAGRIFPTTGEALEILAIERQKLQDLISTIEGKISGLTKTVSILLDSAAEGTLTKGAFEALDFMRKPGVMGPNLAQDVREFTTIFDNVSAFETARRSQIRHAKQVEREEILENLDKSLPSRKRR